MRGAPTALAQRAFARSGASVEIVAPRNSRGARSPVRRRISRPRRRSSMRRVRSAPGCPSTRAVVQAAAQFKLAYRNLKRTTIVAPVDGTIGQRSVQVGQQVGPGVPLMSIVQLNQLWIEANFKEGQIRHMRIGQPVEVVSDLYGSRVTYRGRVQGFSAGTGSAFSMLPSQNAAGNWIKVVQRVPVVIALDARDLAAHPLRVGLSMRATVDTHDRNGHALDSEPPTPAVSTRVHDGVASDAEAPRPRSSATIRAGNAGPSWGGRLSRPAAARRVAALASAFKRLQHHHHPARHPTHQTFRRFPPRLSHFRHRCRRRSNACRV